MSLKVLDLAKGVVSRETRPAHWLDAEGTAFKNPWSSSREFDWKDKLWIAQTLLGRTLTAIPADISQRMPVRKPVWDHGEARKDNIKATWLGHAAFLVEMPHRAGAERGIRILFDPALSDYCSPVDIARFKRITPPASTVADLPDVDAVVISHDHYDHLDFKTILALTCRSHMPHFFAPRGNDGTLKSFGIPESHRHTLDWWESRRLSLDLPSSDDKTVGSSLFVDITCTPAQHNCGRTAMDKVLAPRTLWGSWVVEDVPDDAGSVGKKAYFSGDTAYRALLDGKKETDCPSCPAFKEIGERFGGFDAAMLPIGCYLPHRFMSPLHSSPRDSVQIFQDIRAKRAVAMHWGTWILSEEPVLEPPEKLKEECAAAGLAEDAFTACELGETRFF
ncbi:N-acyl-phosphatidylethanolamine-hydrolyzing phospholipase D [Schizophyllum amplum]|uniref:N-acyl-phosphatidylethanolamine-hydrolyzing phospholipase D n=1 Tax=Schizophyllum amplum TaxID=97359 RepID=A0A550CGK9_9AGAR|nr:N-acyl-phosphatidylethanolamine-hydrolyzing phospholipase D [Auriculariopsis ampla]